MNRLFQLRTSLMLPQAELAALLNTFQARISEVEKGVATNPKWENELYALLENPSELLLHRLIRLIKFRNLVQELAGGKQEAFAEKARMSQGAVSIFLRARKKLLESRWLEILGNLQVSEPITTEKDIEDARELFLRIREDEGFLLQSRLKESKIPFGAFAEKCGVSQSTVSMWFATKKLSTDTKRRVNKAFASF